VKKISTVAERGNKIFKDPKLTIGFDLGDRTSHYFMRSDSGAQPADDTEGNPASLQ
jgi:hypothetical protein